MCYMVLSCVLRGRGLQSTWSSVVGVECWHNGLLHSLDGCGEQRESATSTFLQLMCLFAFCICFFCWKGARHCCFYIFTTNVHFPGQEENSMFSQQIKLAFCRAVCKSSLFHPTLSMNYFFQKLIYPLTKHFRPCTTSRSNFCNHVCTYIQLP